MQIIFSVNFIMWHLWSVHIITGIIIDIISRSYIHLNTLHLVPKKNINKCNSSLVKLNAVVIVLT